MKSFLNSSTKFFYKYFLLFVKRLSLFATGIAITYIIAWELFPALNNNYSIITTILLTYIISAYIIIPAGIRVIRIWYPPTRIPHFTTTPDGFNNDPVNIAIVGTKSQLENAMKRAGWYKADKKTINTTLKLILSTINRSPYPDAPFSSLYLFGRKQDIGFQMPVGSSHISRHHVRFWASSKAVSEDFIEHVHFWQKKLKTSNTNFKLLWVGAAIKDIGLGIIKYHGQLSHSVDEDTNAERDHIVHTLQRAGCLKEVIKVKAGEEISVSNRVIGSNMISDGMLHICVLK